MPADRPPRRATHTKPKYTFSDDEDDAAHDPGSEPHTPYHNFLALPPPATPPVHTPIPTARSSHTRKRPPTHIPRPRNAYIIFRSEFCKRQKMSETGIETDHRRISCIAGLVWNNLPEEEKLIYKQKAEQEKAAHKAAHPEYRYTPIGRESPPIRRRAKRETKDDANRCRKLAELFLSGIEGEEFQKAARELDEGIVQVELTPRTSHPVPKQTKPSKARETQREIAPPSPSVDIQDSPEAPFGVVSLTPSPALSHAPYTASEDDFEMILTPTTPPFSFPLAYETQDQESCFYLPLPVDSFMHDSLALPLNRSAPLAASTSISQYSSLGEVSYSNDDLVLTEYLMEM